MISAMSFDSANMSHAGPAFCYQRYVIEYMIGAMPFDMLSAMPFDMIRALSLDMIMSFVIRYDQGFVI